MAKESNMKEVNIKDYTLVGKKFIANGTECIYWHPGNGVVVKRKIDKGGKVLKEDVMTPESFVRW